MQTAQKKETMTKAVIDYSNNLNAFMSNRYPDLLIDANEIINETWITINELTAKQLQEIEKPKSYAKSMIYNELYKRMRKEKKESAKQSMPITIIKDSNPIIKGFINADNISYNEKRIYNLFMNGHSSQKIGEKIGERI